MDGLDATSINCSVSYRWMQQTNASVILKPPVVTNSTIEMMIRLPVTLAKLAGAPAQVTHPPAAKAPEGFVVLGLTIQRPSDAVVIPAYAATNILFTSVVPIPVATSLVPLACLLYGFLGGMLLNVGTTCCGAYLGLLLSGFRPSQNLAPWPT